MTEAYSSPGNRPSLAHNDTLDAPELVGTISRDGTAVLKPVRSSLATPNRPRFDLNEEDSSSSAISDGEEDDAAAAATATATADDEDEIEDYDDLILDPDTIIEGSSGGNLENIMSQSDVNLPKLQQSLSGTGHIRRKSDTHVRHASPDTRRKSIQIRLEKTGKKGQYILTADDPELREILRKGLEREEASLDPTKRGRTIRDYVFTRQFTTFDRQNPLSSESPFHGFFTLFWLAMVLIFLRVSAYNWKQYGNPLGDQAIMKLMFGHDVFLLGLTDATMCLSTSFCLFLQRAVAKGQFNWGRYGWIIQNVWQTCYLFAVISWTLYREWPWTHTVFIVLHAMVFLMKQHSYSFYNGYLSSVYRRRNMLKSKLDKLRELKSGESAPNSPRAGLGSGFELPNIDTIGENRNRRPSMGPRTSTNLGTEQSDVARVSAAMETGSPLDLDHMQAFERIIQDEIDGLDKELQGKSSSGKNAYPNNLTVGNFVDWTFLPTLVYELEYPRQEKINWWYVAEKTAATFGVLAVMQIISQAYIYPPVAETVRMKEAGVSLQERLEQMPWTISDLTFPLLLEQLLTWYLIWVC